MKSKHEPLFDKVELPDGVEPRNRLVLALLTHISSNDDGTISDVELPYTEKRSQDVGITINAVSNVSDVRKAFPEQPSITHDNNIERLKRLATVMKKNGAKAFVRICYGGAQALFELIPDGDVVAPNPISLKSFDQRQEYSAREMTNKEIEQATKNLGEAARRAIEAGFDGVEIRGANHYLIYQFAPSYYNRRNDVWTNQYKLPVAAIEEVLKTKEVCGNKDFIVGYRLSPEEAESPGIAMEIIERLVNKIGHVLVDYIHASMMDTYATTREGKYAGQKRLSLIHKWINGRMPLIGIGSIFTADGVLDAVENVGIDLIAIGRELLLDYQFVEKIRDGREGEIINYFDPEREDNHHLTPDLWHQFNEGFYPLPRRDK